MYLYANFASADLGAGYKLQEDAHDFLRQWLDNVHDLHEEQLKKLFPESKVQLLILLYLDSHV